MFLTTLCRALNNAKIRYAVVGGYAVALHGAVRGTVDVDLVLSFDEDSFVDAERVFHRLGLRGRLPVDAKQVFQFRKEYLENRNLVAWSFYDPIHPAHQLDVILTHDLNKMDVETFPIEGVKVCVVSIKSLIKMKKASDRPQDREDVKALQGILKHAKR